jgi:hypothetical protein
MANLWFVIGVLLIFMALAGACESGRCGCVW